MGGGYITDRPATAFKPTTIFTPAPASTQ